MRFIMDWDEIVNEVGNEKEGSKDKLRWTD